ncbi:MAG: hypothetical protein ACJA1A_002044 [Saprospiraceae bacterium]|jgi:hypothetical protein|tara:strand:+ start:2383 stop:2535 length:153 start_codon:yes stop_codon:yes gene_type:complete
MYKDPRVTIEDGSGNINSSTVDNAADCLIEIQGLTKDGRPFVHYGELTVK